MRINAPEGQKVKYTEDGGYEAQHEQARRHLVINGEYTVERTKVGSWNSDVYLLEVPGTPFNTCMFEEIEPYLEEVETVEELYKDEYMSRWD